jgi:hypothetical protein
MSRAAIVATIVTSTFAFSSFSLAASDEEISHSGDKMSATFKCLTYARMFHDYKEKQRLFEIGLKAARNFYEGVKNHSDTGEIGEFIRKTSTDFMAGISYDSETTKARDEIVKYQNGMLREPSKWLDPSAAKTEAERSYRNGNCSLIQ